jgi:hypothetical protein
LAHGQKEKHWHHSTKNDRLQSEDSHFLVFRPRIIPNNGQCEGCPIACFSAVIIKHPLVPVSPAYNWGQGLVFESILPFMGFRQSCFERDSLRFGFNELKRVGGSHGPEKIGWWLVLDRNQNLGG